MTAEVKGLASGPVDPELDAAVAGAAVGVIAEAELATAVEAAVRGRRRGTPIGPQGEAFKARLRVEAGRTPTHRKATS